AKVLKRALVQPQEGLELLIVHGFFVAVTRVAERYPKHPRSPPFAGHRVQRRRAAKEVPWPSAPGAW
ncbi:MAG TPA: hypothetical protein VHV78_14015, partial [Gemmatimonadaceae bacterium]|nr:hypothetical protein [Gemmatimonadaceae bacterium]